MKLMVPALLTLLLAGCAHPDAGPQQATTSGNPALGAKVLMQSAIACNPNYADTPQAAFLVPNGTRDLIATATLRVPAVGPYAVEFARNRVGFPPFGASITGYAPSTRVGDKAEYFFAFNATQGVAQAPFVLEGPKTAATILKPEPGQWTQFNFCTGSNAEINVTVQAKVPQGSTTL